jgi:hypothetical protein
MKLAASPTIATRRRGALGVFMALLAGIGCGRTGLGEQAGAGMDGGAGTAGRRDSGFGGAPSAAGGTVGPGPVGGAGGVGGSGGRSVGGSAAGGRGAGGSGGASALGGRGTGGTGAGGGGVGGKGTTATGGSGVAGTSPAPLWRNSNQPFCPTTEAGLAFLDMWSDDRGVFAVTSDGSARSTLWSNLGSGWQVAFDWPGETTVLYQGGLKGFAGGPLIVYGAFPCGIQFVDHGKSECSGAAGFVSDISVVRADLAYAVNYDRVLIFDGDFWTQLGGPLPGVGWTSAVWADSSTVIVSAAGDASEGGSLVFKIESGAEPVLLPGLSPEIDPPAVWGFGASDIWVGGIRGQLVHYDGKEWSEMATIPYKGVGSLNVSGANGIGRIKLWGKDGNLFAIAGNIFGQWDGARFKVLESLEGEAFFAGLWGNSPSEIFLAVQDPRSMTGCGPFRAHWFDGKRVGPL